MLNCKHLRILVAVLALCLAVDNTLGDELRIGQSVRTYSAVIPEGAARVPLVLVLHGNTQQGKDMRERTSWVGIARREHFAVVFPDGLNRSWADMRAPAERAGSTPPAGTDDVAFLLALVDHFITNGVADRSRVYVTGVSNGGAMTLTLACQRPDVFAAGASVVMGLTQAMAAACSPSRPLPMLFMNGTADPLVAYNGGRSRSRFAVSDLLSTPETVLFWRRVNGCSPDDAAQHDLPDLDPADHSTVTQIESRCPADADVVLYRVNGGGHRMPDAVPDARHPGLINRALGFQNHDINGPELIWKFFSRFSRK